MHDGEVIRLHGKVELGVVEPRKVNGSVDRGVSLAGGDSHTIERERVAGEHQSSIHFLIPYARRRNARRGVAEIEAAVQTWRVDASFDRDVAVQPSLNLLETRHHRPRPSPLGPVGTVDGPARASPVTDSTAALTLKASESGSPTALAASESILKPLFRSARS